MQFDVFICHASEDKDSFVRPLAEALRESHIEVWYDEFALTLGDSIRRAIDQGLRQSRYGIVVLSEAFFSKNWPQHELDGLIDRELSGGQKVVLTIWHRVGHHDVAAYSPALAGKWAVSSDRGIPEVIKEILKVVKPVGSPLLDARDYLVSRGLEVPVVTDSYWLYAVEASRRLDPAGPVIPDDAHWGRWAFPLPYEDWGKRIALAALQLEWTEAADEIPIMLTTPPDRVLEFIRSYQDLLDLCREWPIYVAEYAPQITIPGWGGELEDVFKKAYRRNKGTDEWSLRHFALGHEVDHTHLAYDYFHPDIFGPDTSPYDDDADHLIWLLSKESEWLPERIRDALLDGLVRYRITWYWPKLSGSRFDWPSAGSVCDELLRVYNDRRAKFRWSAAIEDDWRNRINLAKHRIGLPESIEVLYERVRHYGVIEKAVASERMRK